jgi:hypothetical protein
LRRHLPRRAHGYIAVAVVALAAAGAAAIVSMRGGGEAAPMPYEVADVVEVFKNTGAYSVHSDHPLGRRELPDGYRAFVRGNGYGGLSAEVYEDASAAAAGEKFWVKLAKALATPAWTTNTIKPQWLAPAAAKKSWLAQKKLLAEREKSLAANTRKPKWPSIARCANVVVITGWAGAAQQVCAELAELP